MESKTLLSLKAPYLQKKKQCRQAKYRSSECYFPKGSCFFIHFELICSSAHYLSGPEHYCLCTAVARSAAPRTTGWAAATGAARGDVGGGTRGAPPHALQRGRARADRYAGRGAALRLRGARHAQLSAQRGGALLRYRLARARVYRGVGDLRDVSTRPRTGATLRSRRCERGRWTLASPAGRAVCAGKHGPAPLRAPGVGGSGDGHT